MTKVLDGERGAFHITQAVRGSKRVQKGVRLDMTGAFGANRPETLPYVSHAADISLSSQMASQIAGISRLTSFCFSFFSTAIIEYNGLLPWLANAGSSGRRVCLGEKMAGVHNPYCTKIT